LRFFGHQVGRGIAGRALAIVDPIQCFLQVVNRCGNRTVFNSRTRSRLRRWRD
jgi:hypothetical protein